MYVISGKYKYVHNLDLIPYKSRDGILTITTSHIIFNLDHYMWDGMTFCHDGKRLEITDDTGNKLPVSWKGSLLHDVLIKYWMTDRNLPLTKKECDKLLLCYLQQNTPWINAWCYLIYVGVRLFGWMFNRKMY